MDQSDLPKIRLNKVTMKLISMMTLLLTDADVTFTIMGLFTFYKLGQDVLTHIAASLLGTYFGGCLRAYFAKHNFVTEWVDKVKDGMVPEFEYDEVAHIRTEDQFYKICSEPHGGKPPCLYIYYSERRRFRRTLVLLRHSIPYFRTMSFAWKDCIKPVDFAGILNANSLWSFTSGIGVQGCSLYYTYMEGFNAILLGSLMIGVGTTVMSIANIVLDFPGQLALLEQNQTEKMTLEIQADKKVADQMERMENIKTERMNEVMNEEALRTDPVGAVTQHAEDIKAFNEAKKLLLKTTLKDLKDAYDMRKKAYEEILQPGDKISRVAQP